VVYELLGGISLLSPEYLLSVERWPFHSEPPDHYDLLSHLLAPSRSHFDWSLIPEEIVHQAVLSGGLNVQNVTDAVRSLRPHAVDVSSGIESSKGIKDAALMQAFVNAVRAVDTH